MDHKFRQIVRSIKNLTQEDFISLNTENNNDKFVQELRSMSQYCGLTNVLQSALSQQYLLKSLLMVKKDIPAAVFLHALFDCNSVLGKIAARKVVTSDFILAKNIAIKILQNSISSKKYKRFAMPISSWQIMPPLPLAEMPMPPSDTNW